MKNNLYHKVMWMKSFIPAGKQGDWEVEKFTVSKQGAAFHNLRQAINNRGREIRPGKYTRLTYHGVIIMSDTPAEMQDHVDFVYKAHGNVLVNGLGLGLVVQGLMLKPNIEHITVIEISSEVISLVGNHLKKKYGERITIINADALTWKSPKGKRYNYIWHDIWPTICGDWWPEIKKLERRYAHKTYHQSSWCKFEIRRAGI